MGIKIEFNAPQVPRIPDKTESTPSVNQKTDGFHEVNSLSKVAGSALAVEAQELISLNKLFRHLK